MTREEKIALLNNLLEIEEKNDIGNLTRRDRAEFQIWVKALEQEPCSNCIEFKRYAKQMGFELEQEPKTEWIPISERLPKDGNTVIASVKGYIYPEARYIKGYGWEWAYESGTDYWEELEDVTAWMPLPKPYKEG